MPQVIIHHIGDIVGRTTLTIDEMPVEALAELQELRLADVAEIAFLEGRTPTSGDFAIGQAIKIRSITAIEVVSP